VLRPVRSVTSSGRRIRHEGQNHLVAANCAWSSCAGQALCRTGMLFLDLIQEGTWADRGVEKFDYPRATVLPLCHLWIRQAITLAIGRIPARTPHPVPWSRRQQAGRAVADASGPGPRAPRGSWRTSST